MNGIGSGQDYFATLNLPVHFVYRYRPTRAEAAFTGMHMWIYRAFSESLTNEASLRSVARTYTPPGPSVSDARPLPFLLCSLVSPFHSRKWFPRDGRESVEEITWRSAKYNWHSASPRIRGSLSLEGDIISRGFVFDFSIAKHALTNIYEFIYVCGLVLCNNSNEIFFSPLSLLPSIKFILHPKNFERKISKFFVFFFFLFRKVKNLFFRKRCGNVVGQQASFQLGIGTYVVLADGMDGCFPFF